MSSIGEFDRGSRPVVYQGALVAIAGRDRCHVLTDDLDATDLRMVLAMCLFMREVVEARAPGPFTSERAEEWAASILSTPRRRPSCHGERRSP